MKIISRKEAKSLGLTHYFTGKPCVNGHISKRVIQGKCCQCDVENQRARRANPEKAERIRLLSREAWARNEALRKRKSEYDKKRRSSQEYLEKQREMDRDRYKKDPSFSNRKKAQAAKYYANNKRRLQKIKLRNHKEKYRNCPEYKAAVIARAILNRCHKQAGSTKKDRYYIELGYTSGQLKEHIERQFSKGMTWDNYGEWHIDHIVPVSSFIRSGETSPSVINALSNLRPLWAEENMKKGANSEVLL